MEKVQETEIDKLIYELAELDPCVRKEGGKYFRGGVELTIPCLFGYRKELSAWDGLLHLLTSVGFEIGFTKDCIKVYSHSQLHSDKVYKGSCHAEALFNLFMQNSHLCKESFYCSDCLKAVRARYEKRR